MISVLDEQQGAPAAQPPAAKALVLALAVVDARPVVWRRIVVPESLWLNQLHEAIQIAFDWYDYQTHDFMIGGTLYGNPCDRGDIFIEDDRNVTLAEVDFAARGQVLYQYHYGEGWSVEIRVEKVIPLAKDSPRVLCVAGERAGPPEDCGGIDAYEEMVASIKEPHTDTGREWIEWIGPDYDPEKCDLEKINEALKKIEREPDASGL